MRRLIMILVATAWVVCAQTGEATRRPKLPREIQDLVDRAPGAPPERLMKLPGQRDLRHRRMPAIGYFAHLVDDDLSALGVHGRENLLVFLPRCG